MRGAIPPLPQDVFMAHGCSVKKTQGKLYLLTYLYHPRINIIKRRRNCHSSGRNLLLYKFTKRVVRLTVIIIEESPSYQLPTKFYLTFFWPG
jgi:hypothetical protein